MPSSKFWSYENTLVAILGLGGAVAALDGQALFYLSPFVAKDLHLNNAKIGLVASIVVVTWALAAYAVGSLSDRTGKRKQYLVIGFLVFAVCSGLSGLASSFALLFGARALIGFAEGPVIPISQSMMMAESSPQRRGLNMGIVQNLGAQLVGSMLGPLIIVRLAQAFNWHAAFYIAGFPGLVVAVLIALYVRNPAREMQSLKTDDSSMWATVVALLGYRNIRACLVISCFVVAYYFLILTFLPLYCVNVLHMSPTRMSVVLGCTGAAGVVSAGMVPYLSDRVGRKPALGLFALLGMLAPIGALAVGSSYGVLLGFVFVGSLIPGTTPLFMGTIPLETVPPRYAAAASGLILGVGQIVGGFSAPALAGVIADRLGLAVPLWIAIAMSLCAAVSCFWLRETAPARVRLQLPTAVGLTLNGRSNDGF